MGRTHSPGVYEQLNARTLTFQKFWAEKKGEDTDFSEFLTDMTGGQAAGYCAFSHRVKVPAIIYLFILFISNFVFSPFEAPAFYYYLIIHFSFVFFLPCRGVKGLTRPRI